MVAKGRSIQGYNVNRMRAVAEASLLDDSGISRRLANLLLDALDAHNDEDTDYELLQMYRGLGVDPK